MSSATSTTQNKLAAFAIASGVRCQVSPEHRYNTVVYVPAGGHQRGQGEKGNTCMRGSTVQQKKRNAQDFSFPLFSLSLGLPLSTSTHRKNARPEHRCRVAPDQDVSRYVPGMVVANESNRGRDGYILDRVGAWCRSGCRVRAFEVAAALNQMARYGIPCQQATTNSYIRFHDFLHIYISHRQGHALHSHANVGTA